MPFLVQIEQLQCDKRSRSTSARNRTRPQWHPPSRVSSISASSCVSPINPSQFVRHCRPTAKRGSFPEGGDGGMTARKMRLGLSIRCHGYHPSAWRHPNAPADAPLHVEHYVRSAQIAEQGKLDMIFFADGAGIRQGDDPRGSLSRTGRDMVELEPMTLLPALAMVTSHVGLVTTASTTYNEPYNLARKFATLDLISKGRAGWNVVASWSELEARNFGLATTLRYDTRYARSAELVEVVKGLWDGWEDGALLLDKATGQYFDETKMHVLNHVGTCIFVSSK